MAEAQTLGRADSDETAKPPLATGPETYFFTKVMTSASVRDVKQRVFYFTVLLLALWLVLTLVVGAIKGWPSAIF